MIHSGYTPNAGVLRRPWQAEIHLRDSILLQSSHEVLLPSSVSRGKGALTVLDSNFPS